MDAIILLNKPANMTSFQATARLRRIFHEKKVGHTGTLDPNATGLLIVLLGKYTKLAPYCVKDHKKYHAVFRLGEESDTGDIWGSILRTKQPKQHTAEELDSAAKMFLGDIEQIPPMYSAIKIDGKKLYELARNGQTIERKARKVHISELKVEQIGDNLFSMDAVVSSGTYIRTLIMDFAAQLDELGVMCALERTAIEHISLDDAVSFEQLESGNYKETKPIQVLNPYYELIEVDCSKEIMNGRSLRIDATSKEVILVNKEDVLAAYELREDGRYHSLRGLF